MKPWMKINPTAVGFFVEVVGDYYLTPLFISWGGHNDEILGVVIKAGVEHFYFCIRLYAWPLTISIALPRMK